jgi:flagellar biosynthesis GTPase FlhF
VGNPVGKRKAMHPETRHKAIIALSFLIAVGWVNYRHYDKPVEAGIFVFIAAFPLLYAGYYALHVVGWVAFDGENGTGLRIIPRIWRAITWVIRSFSRAVTAILRGVGLGTASTFRATGNALDHWRYERQRPERERLASEAADARAEQQRRDAEAERLRRDEERQRNEIAEAEAHKRRVERESEVTEARTKAELSARLQVQAEANRLEAEHAQRMLAIEQERIAISEQRGKRHEGMLNTLANLVEKSKG